MRLTEKTLKTVRLQLLGTWGMLSFLACTMEEALEQAIGIASLLLCFCVGHILNQKSLLPDVEEENEEDW